MSETTTCAVGCTIRGQHRTSCDHQCRHRHRGATCPPACDGTCPGCLPRPADIGTLCQWCWQRLNGDVVDAPALARYLWAVGHAGETTPTTEPVDGGPRPSERSVLHEAIDTLDGLHATLASWAHLILDEHPDGHQMRGPDETLTRRTLSTIRDIDGETFIRPSETAGVRDPEATSQLVRWLLPHLTWCAGQHWAGEMRREVAAVVRTTAARYPVTQRTRAIPGVECPDCQRTTLVYDPATPERHTVQVTCSSRGCGRIYTEDEFARLVKRIEWERAHPTGQATA